MSSFSLFSKYVGWLHNITGHKRLATRMLEVPRCIIWLLTAPDWAKHLMDMKVFYGMVTNALLIFLGLHIEYTETVRIVYTVKGKLQEFSKLTCTYNFDQKSCECLDEVLRISGQTLWRYLHNFFTTWSNGKIMAMKGLWMVKNVKFDTQKQPDIYCRGLVFMS